MIHTAAPSLESEVYQFVGQGGKLIPTNEEDKRAVLWDCGRQVLLRPDSWLAIE